LTYDDASNVKTVTDSTGTPETATYSYDQLNRLTGATGFAGGQTAAYTYNAIGNLLAKQEGASNFTLSYPASGATSVRPHAVSSTTGTLARTMNYDANGNLRASGDYAYDFDDENRLATTVKSQEYSPGPGLRCVRSVAPAGGTINSGDLGSLAAFVGTTKVPNLPNGNGKYYNPAYDLDLDGAVTSADQSRLGAASGTSCPTTIYRYVYDGNGTLLKRQTYDRAHYLASPVDTTVYIGGVYEKNTLTGGIKKYYTALGRTLALRDVPTGSGTGTLVYLLTDHLGSTVEILDSAGATVSELDYWPYGGSRSGSITSTDRKFTSQREEPGDATLGLYNYKARFYSTVIGRFVSADPLAKDSLNRYSYVLNNPLRYTDPTGRCVGGLDCDPVRSLNILTCAASRDACVEIIAFQQHDLWATNPRAFFALVDDAVLFARAAYKNEDYWGGMLERRVYDPFYYESDIYAFYGRSRGQYLLREASRLWRPVVREQGPTIYGRIRSYCSNADCGGIVIDLTGLAAGFANTTEFDRYLAALGLYTAQVEYAWSQYKDDPTQENYYQLWVQISATELTLE
jgi:RHS repeat-associated protein